jgi:hypothetical protein
VLLAALKGPLKGCVYVEQWWERWGLDQVQNATTLLNDPWILNRDNLGRPTASATPALAIATNETVVGKIDQALALLNAARAALTV